MVTLYPSPPDSPEQGEAQVIIGLSCYYQTLKSQSPIAQADLLQASLAALMRAYLECAP